MSNSCIYIKAITKATSTLPYSVIGEAVLDFREIARKENDEENDTKGIANSPLRQQLAEDTEKYKYVPPTILQTLPYQKCEVETITCYRIFRKESSTHIFSYPAF
jgi:hypothetical protein